MAEDPQETGPVEQDPMPGGESEPAIVELPEGPENVEYRGGRTFGQTLFRERDEGGD